jgi:hypothetical protein
LEQECGDISLFETQREIQDVSVDISKRISSELLSANSSIANYRRNSGSPDRFERYLWRSLAEELEENLSNRVIVTKEADYNQRSEVVFVTPWSSLERLVQREDPSEAMDTVYSFPCISLSTWLSKIEQLSKVTTMVAGSIRPSVVSVLTPQSENPTEDDSREAKGNPQIGVEFLGNLDFDQRNDMPWYPVSDIDSAKVILYVNRESVLPLSSDTRDTLDELGIEVVDRTSWRPREDRLSFFCSVLRELYLAGRTLADLITSSRGVIAKLIAENQLIFGLTRDRWTAFLQEYNIKIHTHPTGNARALPIAAAADTAGCVDIRHQTSMSHFIQPLSGKVMSHHVYFASGTLFHHQMKEQNRTPDTTLIGGEIQQTARHDVEERAITHRQRLKKNGCEYIIAVYDSTFGEDIYNSKEVMREFYQTVLKWAIDDPSLGLIIKPKFGDKISELPGIQGIINDLRERNQSIVLQDKTLSAEAALSADIAIGVGLNTAVHEAALIGTPAIHLDLVGMDRCAPYYDEGRGSFIFTEDQSLRKAISRQRTGDRDDLGEYGMLLDRIDPFRDGKAPERLGTYLSDLLDSISDNTLQEAIKAANANYGQNVGEDYVESSF